MTRPDNLILSVDDIGLCRSHDLALTARIDATCLDRVSVMTGLGDLTPVSHWLRQVPALDLHLNLTEHSPRSGTNPQSSLAIARRRLGFAMNMPGKYSPQRAKNLWRRQIEAFKIRFGHPPDGLNSHEHIHLFPPYFRQVVKLAHEYRISYIRLGTQSIGAQGGYRHMLFDIFHGVNLAALNAAGAASSTLFYSYDSGRFTPRALLDDFPDGSEVIFHPDLAGDMEVLEMLVSRRAGNARI